MLSKKRALKQFIDNHIKSGFMHRDEIVQATLIEFRGEFGGKDFLKAICTTVDRNLARYLITESAWVLPTDCDKLDRAFDALQKEGVVTRQHFACCNDCGHREMQSELRRMGKVKHRSVKGFAFFHQQDTARAVKSGSLYITFDALATVGEVEVDKAIERALLVGERIVAALSAAGLKTHWDGSYLRRIEVPVTWRKRRFSGTAGSIEKAG
jgi:hypothetical protein